MVSTRSWELSRRLLPDKRIGLVVPLTFGRARIVVMPYEGSVSYNTEDAW